MYPASLLPVSQSVAGSFRKDHTRARAAHHRQPQRWPLVGTSITSFLLLLPTLQASYLGSRFPDGLLPGKVFGPHSVVTMLVRRAGRTPREKVPAALELSSG